MELGRLAITGETVSLSDAARGRHLYAVGASGVGKTSFLETMMRQDLEDDRGFCFLDPHGDSAQKLADSVPKHRLNDIIYLDVADLTASCALNLLDGIHPDDRHPAAARLMSSFKTIFLKSWGPRLEYYLTHGLWLLMEHQGTRNKPGQTLLNLSRLFYDTRFRDTLLSGCSIRTITDFWDKEYAPKDKRFLEEAISPIQNKVGQVLMSPAIQHLLGQSKSTIHLKEILDGGKVLIVNLSKGRLGDEPAHLLGALIISAIHQAAQSRSGIPESERRSFTLYVDEFQNFATDSFATILSEARKWKLSLILAHQFASQTPEEILDAVVTNAGTMVSFRISDKDARIIAPEMGLEGRRLLTDLPDHTARIKRIQNGRTTQADLLETFPPAPAFGSFEAVRSRTRARYARSRTVVERQIARA